MQKQTNESLYRVVRYFNQWPQGNEHEVIADDLTREEAEKIQNENLSSLAFGEDILVERIIPD